MPCSNRSNTSLPKMFRVRTFPLRTGTSFIMTNLDRVVKFYHDHAVEIATGRVQVLDRSPEEAKKIAETAAQTDGIIFHLWLPDDGKAPNGIVGHPQSVGHKERTAKEFSAK